MKKLLQFEYRKIFRFKSLYICGGVALFWMTVTMISALSSAPPEEELAPSPTTFALCAIFSSALIAVFGVFLGLYVCDDTSSHTLKNIYAKGYTRSQVFFAKYLVSMSVTAAAALICIGYAYVFGMEFCSSMWSPGGSIPLNLLAQIVLLLVYHALFFAVDSVSGEIGFSLVFNLIGPTILVGLLTAATTFIDDKLSFDRYWVDETLGQLSAGGADAKLLGKAFAMGAVYIMLFLFVGGSLNRKKEV